MACTGRVVILLAAAALAASATGCTHSTRTYSYDAQTVWQACVGESVIWRPDLINEDDYVITSRRITLGGGEVRCDLKVTPMPPMFKRPRTRVAIRMAQTRPVEQRFTSEEVRFLDRLDLILQRFRPPAPGRPAP